MFIGRLVFPFLLAAVTCEASQPSPCRSQAVSAPLRASVPHVRSNDPIVLAALARGVERSGTFRRLVQRLEASDVIVHVERRPGAHRPSGFTQFIAATRHVRYLRITLAAAAPSDATVALLGHELRHALETAEAPQVTDESSYREMYREIGRSSCAAPRWCFDTSAAVQTGARVRAELRARRSGRRSAAQHYERQRID
jgi:hypothetical protein